MNKLVKSNKTPFGTNADKINYNLNEKNATMKYNVNKIDDILVHLRSIMIQRGYIGIMSMRRTRAPMRLGTSVSATSRKSISRPCFPIPY